MLIQNEIYEKTRYAVTLILNKKFDIPNEEAEKMVVNSSFNELLLKDPEYIQHRSATYWAEDILDEYQMLN